jgi:hypothetical protein
MNVVEQISNLLGPCVLLPIPKGTKGPVIKGWQKLTRADMTPQFLSGFNGANIGVLLGKLSDGLCTIDADSDDRLAQILEINPALADTLQSRGQRGGNLWIRVRGDFPLSCKLKTIAGQDWGEWRADGNQTVIHGQHPSGCEYSTNGKKPIEIAFEEIRWPDDLELPWSKKEPPPALPMPEILDDTDLGRGHHFIERFDQDVRHVYARGQWIVFEQGRWNATSDGAVYRLCDELCKEPVNEALRTKSEKERKSALASAMRWGDRRVVDDMLHWARNDLRVIVRPEQLDADPWMLGAPNAIADLRTGKLFKHSRDQLVTKFVGVELDPGATCLRWEQFIAEIYPTPSCAVSFGRRPAIA